MEYLKSRSPSNAIKIASLLIIMGFGVVVNEGKRYIKIRKEECEDKDGMASFGRWIPPLRFPQIIKKETNSGGERADKLTERKAAWSGKTGVLPLKSALFHKNIGFYVIFSVDNPKMGYYNDIVVSHVRQRPC